MTDERAQRVEIVEATPAEVAWAEWANSQDIDTGNRCTCGGHEGLGIDWHTYDCPGANYALRQKVLALPAIEQRAQEMTAHEPGFGGTVARYILGEETS